MLYSGASVSNMEANAIIAELDEYNTESKVTLAIPHSPDGFVRILDEKKEDLHSDPVKAVSILKQKLYKFQKNAGPSIC